MVKLQCIAAGALIAQEKVPSVLPEDHSGLLDSYDVIAQTVYLLRPNQGCVSCQGS